MTRSKAERLLVVAIDAIGDDFDSIIKLADIIVEAAQRSLVQPSDLEAAIERRRKP